MVNKSDMNKKIILGVLFFLLFVGIIAFIIYKVNSEVNVNENTRILTKFEVKGEEVYMSGIINTRTYGQFLEIIKKNPKIKTIVELDMEGSIDDEAMIKLAYYVRKKGLNTKLLSYSNINSGPVDLFLPGVERTMEKGAHLGVHSWSDGKKEAK
jgi:beta-lactamase class D